MKKQKKFNEFVQHMIDCQSLGNTNKAKALQQLQDLYEEISKLLTKTSYIYTKKTYKSLLEQVEVLIGRYKRKSYRLMESSIQESVNYQTEWNKDFFKSIGKTIVIPTTILAGVKFSPVAQTVGYNELVDNTVYKIRQSINNSMKVAYLTKENLNSVTERFNKRITSVEKEVESNIKNVETNTISTVDYLVYKANDIKSVYCSILDVGTCLECGMLNGKVYTPDTAPLLPQHFNCRCFLVPQDIVEEMPESYGNWFDSLDEEDKLAAVGPSRYRLYQAGVPVTKFTDNQNKTIPVKDITKNNI